MSVLLCPSHGESGASQNPSYVVGRFSVRAHALLCSAADSLIVMQFGLRRSLPDSVVEQLKLFEEVTQSNATTRALPVVVCFV